MRWSRQASFWAGLFFWGMAPGSVLAHGQEKLGAGDLWTAWALTPDIVIPTALLVGVYIRGMWKRRRMHRRVPPWRHVAFFSGTLLIFLALQSPIDPFAERAFWIHQVQHLLLRMGGPMLLALSWPEGTLIAGLPRWARRGLLRPLARSTAMRGLVGFFRGGVVVFLFFIGSLYFWQIPSIHNAALRSPGLHYLMHATMLLSGLLFFWRIFERAPPPRGLRYGIRVVMLIGESLFSIVLGSIITLKTVLLYTAYDDRGRLLVETPFADEQSGGFIIWMSAPMMAAAAILIVMVAWNRDEERRYGRRLAMPFSNSAALEFPETAEELWMKVEKPNRDTALSLSLIPISIVLLIMGLAIIGHI